MLARRLRVDSCPTTQKRPAGKRFAATAPVQVSVVLAETAGVARYTLIRVFYIAVVVAELIGPRLPRRQSRQATNLQVENDSR